MRVESDKPAKNGGWVHKGERPHGDVRPAYRPEPKPRLPWSAMWALWFRATSPDQIDDLAATLSVSPDSLNRIGAVWAEEHRAWAFPMRTAGGLIVGFRLRPLAGRKFAVKHSTNALFMPWPLRLDKVLYITEGESDLAALLTIGLTGVGRPSCSSCREAVASLVEARKPVLAVIVADNDDAGLGGAYRLAEAIPGSVVWTPPCKDLREFVAAGGTRQMIENAVRDLEPTTPYPTEPKPATMQERTP
jgi:hypothetical protein